MSCVGKNGFYFLFASRLPFFYHQSIQGHSSKQRSAIMSTKNTMRALLIKEPYKVAVEDRPIPKIVDPTDVVVKVCNYMS